MEEFGPIGKVKSDVKLLMLKIISLRSRQEQIARARSAWRQVRRIE
jgi:hypothetical protein